MGGGERNTKGVWVGNPEGETSCVWKNIIKMGLKQKGWNVTDWVSLAQDRDKWRVL
jgi:hypothetical protein